MGNYFQIDNTCNAFYHNRFALYLIRLLSNVYLNKMFLHLNKSPQRKVIINFHRISNINGKFEKKKNNQIKK